MSFATSKEKSLSEKTVLVEVDLGKEQSKWVNYRNGVWSWTFNTYKQEHTHAGYGYGNYLYGSYGYSGTFSSGIPLKPPLIGSVYASETQYTEKTTLVSCVETEESYYYDVTAFKLYVHTTDNNDIATYLMVVGFTYGVSNRAKNLNSIYYEPRLTGVPVLGKTKDPLYFGVIKYDGGTITLNNADGFYDHLKDNYTLGQPVTIKYGFDDEAYSTYATLFKGYVESLELTYNECVMDVLDNRKKLSKVLPTHFFDKTTYSNLHDEDVGKPIPLVWGTCYNAPCICTNKAETGPPALYVFQIADVADHSYGISAITTVYVDGVATETSSKHPTTGTFKLGNANYTAGQKVTADVVGFIDSISAVIDDPLDVIEDILNTYLSIAYNATNFDQTEWAAAKADSLSSDIGLWVGEETEIIDLIEQISRSAFGNFIIKDDGKYTFRIFDSTDAASETLIKREILKGGGVSVVYDGAEFLTSCNVSYGRNWEENKSRWYNHTSLEADIYNRYHKYQSKDFETLLTTSANASTLATALMAYMRDVQAAITIQTSVQNIQLEIGDIVNFTIDRPDKTWMGATKVEIIGRDIDLLGNTVTLIGREV